MATGDYGPCISLHVPENSQELSFQVGIDPVDMDHKGAGYYELILYGPEETRGHEVAPSPGTTATFEETEDLPGNWTLRVFPQGASADAYWDVAVTMQGESTDTPDTIQLEDC